MNIGDKVKVNSLEPNPKFHGMTGVIVGVVDRYTVQVKMDNDRVMGFYAEWLDPVTSNIKELVTSRKTDLAVFELAARYADRDAAYFAINDFRDWLIKNMEN